MDVNAELKELATSLWWTWRASGDPGIGRQAQAWTGAVGAPLGDKSKRNPLSGSTARSAQRG